MAPRNRGAPRWHEQPLILIPRNNISININSSDVARWLFGRLRSVAIPSVLSMQRTNVSGSKQPTIIGEDRKICTHKNVARARKLKKKRPVPYLVNIVSCVFFFCWQILRVCTKLVVDTPLLRNYLFYSDIGETYFIIL